MFKKSFRVVVLILGVMLSGCFKAPEEQMSQANSAMSAATSAQSDVYATAEHAAAQEAVAKAQREVEAQNAKFVLFRSYKQAESLYAAATESANRARDAAVANKEMVKAEAMALAGEARMALDAAAAALKTAPRGKGTKADLDAMTAELASLNAMLPELDSAMSAEDYMGARTKAASIKESAARIQADVDAAKEKMAAMRKKK